MRLPNRFKPLWVLLIALSLYGLSTIFSFFVFNSHPQTSIIPRVNPTPVPTPTPTPDPLAPINLLLLGYAGPNHDGGNLSDTLIVAHTDPRQKKVLLISIPRDLWVNLPVTQNSLQSFKINAAYAIGNDDRRYLSKAPVYSGPTGGYHLAAFAVNQVTGIIINHTVAVNFQGFEDIINLFGGVTVNVPFTFTDPYYPLEGGKETDTCGKSPEEIQAEIATLSGDLLDHQFNCRYETLHFEKGIQTMDAVTALKFVRSRHSEIGGGDFGRSQRQQALLSALKSQLLSLSSIPKILPLVETLLKNVRTDITLDQIKTWFLTFGNPKDFTLTSFTLDQKELIEAGKSADGQYVLLPTAGADNFAVIHQYIQDVFSGMPLTSLPVIPAASPSALPNKNR